MLGCALTPELRRTALRNGGVLHASTQAEPRSGLGLNELLGLPKDAKPLRAWHRESASGSSHDGSYRQKLPALRQHRLNLFPEPQGHGSLRPSFSQSSLSPWTKSAAFLHACLGRETLATLARDLKRKLGCC